jgi:hypothetical protein
MAKNALDFHVFEFRAVVTLVMVMMVVAMMLSDGQYRYLPLPGCWRHRSVNA